MRPVRQSLGQVFRVPALLAALSLFGLVASLVGDGGWDMAGAAALGVPAAVGLVRLLPRSRPRAGVRGYPMRRRSFS